MVQPVIRDSMWFEGTMFNSTFFKPIHTLTFINAFGICPLP